MKCPHCTVEIHAGFIDQHAFPLNGVLGKENGQSTSWTTSGMQCPACLKAIIYLRKHHYAPGFKITPTLIYPKGMMRASAASEVPQDQREDFDESCKVLGDSPKASAALSRRCVQALLRAQGYTHHDLAKAIDAVLVAKALPSALADNLDAIRNIGNFAAHPMKDTNSGAILPVEPHEAEWNLDVLEGLFDYYYVQPAKDKLRRTALNAKLETAGKPALKQ